MRSASSSKQGVTPMESAGQCEASRGYSEPSMEGGNCEAGVVPCAQAFVRHPSLGRRLRYSDHPGVAGAQRCEHDHDLHARIKPRRSWCIESAGQVMMARCAPVRRVEAARRAVRDSLSGLYSIRGVGLAAYPIKWALPASQILSFFSQMCGFRPVGISDILLPSARPFISQVLYTLS